MAVDCPFCSFADHETYFLMQHVELCHPENGESPFMVKEGAGRQEEGINDVEYIECECGESVVLREFESHTELHGDEGMALHEGEKKAANIATSRSPLPAGHTSFSRAGRMPTVSLSDVDASQHDPLDIDTVIKQRSRSKNTKQRHGVNKWKGLLLGTSSSAGRPKTAKDKHKSVRRLGVCVSPFLHCRIADEISRELSSVRMRMKKKCRSGCTSNWSLALRSQCLISSPLMDECTASRP